MANKITSESFRFNIIINGDEARKALVEQEYLVRKNAAALEELQHQLNKLEKEGRTSSQEYSRLTQALEKQRKSYDSNLSTLEKMRRQQSLTTMTISELRSHSTALRAALSKAVPGTENYKRLQKELQQCRSRMKELDRQTSATDKSLCGLAGRVRDYAIGGGATLRTIKQLVSWANQTTDAFKAQDEAMTDAMKTTGLTKEEVKGLNEELKKIDTRTAQNELLALVRIGGKLGITGEEDLLAFVRASDKINVALKEDLGGDAEAAIATIGKLVDIFQLEGQFGLESSLLKVGSAINELGMASTANEGYIVDFTSRLAGIAPNADISISNILGLGATLDKYGQQAETAGTAIGQTIMAMFKRTETFADIAKISLQEFTELLNKDVNEAFLRVLEGMNDGGGLSSVVAAMDQMHLNGQRASTILGTLSKNTAELRAQQELASDAFERGTSLQEEFNVKNTSATALIEKQKKAIEEEVVALGEQLMPVASGALKLSEVGLSVLNGLLSVMIQYKAVIIALAVAYATYNTAKALNNTYTKLSTKLHNIDKAAIAAEVATLNGAKASTIALSAAKNLLVGNFKAAGQAAKLFGASLKTALGPVGLVMLALEGLYAILSPFIKIWRQQAAVNKEIAESEKELAESISAVTIQIDAERNKLETLKSAVLNATIGSKERAKAIAQINNQYGQYLPALLSEKNSNDEIATALATVNSQLERKIKLQAKEAALSKVSEDVNKQIIATSEGYIKALENSVGKSLSAAGRQRVTQMVIDYQKAISDPNITKKQARQFRINLGTEYRKLGGNYLGLRGNRLESLSDSLDDVTFSASKSIAMLNQLYGMDEAPAASSWVVPETPDDSGTPVLGGSGTTSATGKWSLNQDAEFLKAKAELTRQYNEGQIATQAEFEQQLYELEKKSLEDRLALNIESGADRAEIELELQEKTKKHNDDLTKHNEKLAKDQERAAKESADKMVESLENQHELERQMEENKWDEKLAILEKGSAEYNETLRQKNQALILLDIQYLQKLKTELEKILSDPTLTGGFLSEEQIDAYRLRIQQIFGEILKLEAEMTQTSDNSGNSSKKEGSLFGVSQNEWDQFFKNIQDGISNIQELQTAFDAMGSLAQEAFGIVSQYIELTNARENQAARQYYKNNDAKKAALKERLNQGVITQAQYDSDIRNLEAKQEAYEEALAIKQAERQKKMSLSQAIINTALAVMKTFAEWGGWPAGVVPAATMGALGAAQIALISATPVTGKEDGGFISVTRRQDGRVFPARLSPNKRGYIERPTVLVGENGSEYVVPHEAMMNPSIVPFISAIETARKSGRLRNINLSAVNPYAYISGRADGGFVSEANVSGSVRRQNIQQSLSDSEYKELVRLLKRLDVIFSKPINANVSMLGPNGIIQKTEEYNRQVKRGKLNG